jgi:hypothetical protein
MNDEDYTLRTNSNLFSRQWFSRYDQTGLTLEALRLEAHLSTSSYSQAWRTICESHHNHLLYYKRQAKRLNFISLRDSFAPVRLLFDGFWPGFDPHVSPLFTILSLVLNRGRGMLVVDSPHEADIAVYSCFPTRFSLDETDHCTKILYLGENIRPSYSAFDFSLTSHYFRSCGRNTYFPVWLYEILSSGSTYSVENLNYRTISKLCHDRCQDYFARSQSYKLQWHERSDNPVFIGTNYEPLRTEIMRTLQHYGIPLQTYGSDHRPIRNKSAVLGKFKFNVCPENSFSHGYVTEKLINALACGCKSLYWGGLPPSAKSLLRSNGSIIIDEGYTVANQVSCLLDPQFLDKTFQVNNIEAYVEKACRITYKRLIKHLTIMLSCYC